jgi:cytochrome c-type biogenesis protein CcmH/NrfG
MDTWYWLGEGRMEAGDQAGAREAYARALELATTDDDKLEIQKKLDTVK